jgi:hypothetical protein
MPLRTLVIGLDGACWEYLDQVLPDCPHLRRLIDGGVRGRLRSTLPPISPVAWSSFITGKRPASHGIFDWQVREPGGGLVKPATSADRHDTPYWTYLNRAGLKTGVMGIPLTYPPDPVDGFLLPGFDAPWETRHCWHPEGIDAELRRCGPDADLLLAPPKWLPGDRALLDYKRRYDRAATDACIHLSRDLALDCLAVNYMTLDHLNHKADSLATVLEGVRALDVQLGRLLEAFPGANVVVMSDHGSARVSSGFMVNELLSELGLVRYKGRGIDQGHHMEVLVRFLQGTLGLSGLGEKVLRRLLWHGLRLAPRALAERVLSGLYRRDERIFHLNWNLDPEGSVVRLSGGFKSCAIPIYLERRAVERLGLSVAEVAARIEAALAQVRHSRNGRLVFTGCRLGGELFAGPWAHLAPDLVAIIDPEFPDIDICPSYPMGRNSRCEGLIALQGDLFGYLAKGTHSYHGLYVLSGPAFARGGAAGPDMDLFDVPLLLFLLQGVAFPADYEGTIRPEVLAAGLAAAEPGRQDSLDGAGRARDAGLSEESTEEVMDRLRSLGYVD